MALAKMYLEYNDPLRIIWRAGTEEDPYTSKVDSLRIINNRIVLTEIPSKFEKVKISAYAEVSEEIYRSTRALSSTEFYVNYQNGVIQFNQSEEDKTVVAEYKGRGIIQYPAERIYAHNKRKDDVVENLQQIIDESLLKISEADEAVSRVNAARVLTEQATTYANIATDNANLARDGALDAKSQALSAKKEALDAAASTIMIYLQPVQRYADIATTYPAPVNGDRVMVETTGDIYRYDGINTPYGWKLIDNYTGGAIPLASDTASGLMSKDDFISVHQKINKKSVVFVIPTITASGVQKPIIRFPLAGQVVGAYAYCNTPGGATVTKIAIEKLSETDFISSATTWTSITNIDLPNGMSKSVDPVILDDVVNLGDYFRIDFTQLDNALSGLTVQLDIKI